MPGPTGPTIILALMKAWILQNGVGVEDIDQGLKRGPI